MKEQPEQSHGTNFLSYICQKTHCSTGDIFDDEGDDEHDDGDGNDDIETRTMMTLMSTKIENEIFD